MSITPSASANARLVAAINQELEIQARDVPLAELAREARIDKRRLERIFRDETSMWLIELEQICTVIGIGATELLDRAAAITVAPLAAKRNDGRKGPKPTETAICCACGNVRKLATTHHGAREDTASRLDPEMRWVKNARCSHCQEISPHAMINDGGGEFSGRDWAEEKHLEGCRTYVRELRALQKLATVMWVSFDDLSTSAVVERTAFDHGWKVKLNDRHPQKYMIDSIKCAIESIMYEELNGKPVRWKTDSAAKYATLSLNATKAASLNELDALGLLRDTDDWDGLHI